ncbi:MAG: creatininase family protein [Hyphomicrobiaceae bacterium]
MTEKKHLLKDMTWLEFRERLPENPTILLPLGSQEEQGPMAPMGDWMLTEALADRIARQSNAIAAPTLPFGYADYFRPIPGGVAVRPDTFRMVLEDFCENFLSHDLDHLVIFNGHSGNYPLIDQTIRKIKQERGVLIPCLNVWRLLTPEKWEELHPGFGAKAFGHGGDPMTSVYMHMFPELMRLDLIDRDESFGELLELPTAGLNAVKFRGVDVNVAVDITDRCTTGVAGGDPSRSSAEIGQSIADYIVDFTVAFLDHFKSVDTLVNQVGEER